jgi:para-aminobenzoate synthetase/4-amino-4-deoxychorismate lyase
MNRQTPFVALDDARPGHEHVTLFTGHSGIVTAQEPGEVPAAFAAIERALARGLHVAGYFSYELGYALEPRLLPLMPAERRVPLLWFGLFQTRETIASSAVQDVLTQRVAGRAYAGPLRFDQTPESYERGFGAVQDYISAGDIYQANLTFRGRFAFAGDPLALYLQLRARSGAGHGAYVEDGERACLSLSPELFFTVEDGAIAAKPMKGTAARGEDTSADMHARTALRESEKDRAENLMIVDLIRNDIGRVAQTGSVRVEDMFAVETYPTVHQMVSTVGAQLRPGTTTEQIIRALFPCGSVTGAPKIRAMEIIRELEVDARGLYCGAVGAFSPDGAAQFNVAIRTITIADGEGQLGVGGGLVADSSLAGEHDECLLKARYYTESRRPISLIETLRYALDEGFVNGPRHLQRMASSARALGIAFDEASAWKMLRESVRTSLSPKRVRLELSESGAFICESSSLPADHAKQVWRYAISEYRVQSGDALLRHKTSWRGLFDSEYAALRERFGCDEVIFLNERDEITEGSRTNVFARFGDRLITPSLSCGLLDGCLRRALLGDPLANCEEGVLHGADLDRADIVYLGNSLRGVIPAVSIREGETVQTLPRRRLA